jgi:TP53 regulating kinase-like protein
MILHGSGASPGVYFVDFGLGYVSSRIEDMAVDLHLLRQALESKHYRVWKKAFAIILAAYRKGMKNSAAVLKRLEVVEMRGRYKQKGS